MLSPIANLIISSIYYILIVIMVFFSLFGIYVLIRYGEKRSLALIISLLFSIFFLGVLAQSYSTLQSIV